MTKNIVFIGMMGSGKSVIGKAVAVALKRKFYSTDELIEKKAKCKIKDLVARKGWVYFRALEHKIVLQAVQKKGVVIDTGGGVVLNQDNLKALRKNGTIIFLKAAPAVIYKRIKNDSNRPLINVPNPLAEIRRIYKERLPLYNQADVVINTSSASIEGPVARILRKVK